MSEKCAIQTIRLAKLEDDVSSPALSALVEDGWEPMGSVVIDDGEQPKLHMIMKPPKKQQSNSLILSALIAIFVELAVIGIKLFQIL